MGNINYNNIGLLNGITNTIADNMTRGYFQIRTHKLYFFDFFIDVRLMLFSAVTL